MNFSVIFNVMNPFHKRHAGSLSLANFSGAVFSRAHFQRIAQISSLCDFHYKSEGIPSLMHFGLLLN